MENNSSIAASRRGWGYQDKYALLLLLKFLLDDNLKEFFVDKTFDIKDNLSLDVVIVIKKPSDIKFVYEIKTGKHFKGDYKEMGKALKTLFKYSKTNKNVELYLIISPEFSEKIERVWVDLRGIRDKPIGGYFFDPEKKRRVSVKKMASYYIEKLKLKREFKEVEKFIEFLHDFKEFKKGNSYKEEENSDSLEDEILGKINRLLKRIKSSDSETVLDSHYLMVRLLEDIRTGAEEERDIFPLVKNSIIEFATSRCVTSEISKASKLFEEKKREIEKIFTKEFEENKLSEDIDLLSKQEEQKFKEVKV